MGYIYLYTGTGGGKTTNALGLALRCIGHNLSVVIIQFMKWWKEIGEIKIKEKLGSLYEIYQFGRKGWIGLGNLTDEDRKLAEEGLEFARKIVKEKKPFLLVLDEINLAVYCKLLEVDDVLKFLDEIPEETHVVLTGRFAPRELIERADIVNEIVEIKAPKKFPTVKGLNY